MKILQKTKCFLDKNKSNIALGGLLILASVDASAWNVPTAGDTFFDVYDIVVNDLLQGPVGFTAAVSAIVVGVVSLMKANYAVAVPSIVAGGLLSNVEGITTTLGITTSLLS